MYNLTAEHETQVFYKVLKDIVIRDLKPTLQITPITKHKINYHRFCWKWMSLPMVFLVITKIPAMILPTPTKYKY